MTLAQLKRRLKPGTQLRLVFSPKYGGECNRLRTVESVGATMIWFAPDDDYPSRSPLRYGPASLFQGTDNGFSMTRESGMRLEYQWVDKGLK